MPSHEPYVTIQTVHDGVALLEAVCLRCGATMIYVGPPVTTSRGIRP